MWRRERTPPAIGELAELDDDDPPSTRAVVLVVPGLLLMTAGGAAAVAGATRLTEALGRTDEAVGLVVLGFATTAELFALVLASARAGVEEVAVAAVVGSAAYNATTTLGAAAVVAPLRGGRAAAAGARRGGAPAGGRGAGPCGRLGRASGALLTAAYALFVVLVATGL